MVWYELPGDWNELDAVPLWKVKDEEIDIFTPEEMTLLLAGILVRALFNVVAVGAEEGFE